eukprot:SM000110S18903  [mRNA]  locus=s110:209106:210638:+ [translate_table: standard]
MAICRVCDKPVGRQAAVSSLESLLVLTFRNAAASTLPRPHPWQRYLFNGTWHNITDLYFAMEDARKIRQAIVCTVVSIRGEVPCLDRECLVPLYLRPHYSDFSVIKQLIENRELGFIKNYAPTTVLDAVPIARPFLDAGANVGYATLLFGLMWPDARVVAVEASAANFRVLRLNSQWLPNAVLLRAGLYDRSAAMLLVNGSQATREGWQYILRERRPDDDRQGGGGGSPVRTVTVCTLLRLLGLPGFDFVKMDIEGSEREVFTPRPAAVATAPLAAHHDRSNGDPSSTGRSAGHGRSAGYDPVAWLATTKLLSVEVHDRMKEGCRAAVEAALTAGGRFYPVRSGEYAVWHNAASVGNITVPRTARRAASG